MRYYARKIKHHTTITIAECISLFLAAAVLGVTDSETVIMLMVLAIILNSHAIAKNLLAIAYFSRRDRESREEGA